MQDHHVIAATSPNFRDSQFNASIARAYKDAYDIAIQNGDESRARIFAERTYDARRLIEGDDSPVAMKMKRNSPHRHHKGWMRNCDRIFRTILAGVVTASLPLGFS